MTWLDSVLSTPLIGIRLVPNYDKLTEFKENATIVLSKLHHEFKDIRVNPKESDLWGYNIKTDNYAFNINHDNITIKYSYHLKTHNEAGSLPSLKQPEFRNYSDLFDEVVSYAKIMADIFEKIEGLSFDRIGMMAHASLDEESIPPGVNDFIKHLGKPWDNQIHSVKSIIVGELGGNEVEGYSERCHHTIEFAKSKITTLGYALILDWQRVYKDPKPFESRRLLTQIERCKSKCFQYFETFAEGNLNYD